MRRVVAGVTLALWLALPAAAEPHLKGRRLDEALGVLRAAGLPLVFSSEVVTPEMRVLAEPRAVTLEGRLNELLAPYGLKAEAGPGATILVVRDPAADRRGRVLHGAASARPAAARPPPDTPTTNRDGYSDHVVVRGSVTDIRRGGAETTIEGRALSAATAPASSDGLDAVRAMPGVTSDDDFRTDFSVRGSPYRQIGIVIDGVPTHWLQHTVYGRKDAGSLSMFDSGALDRATLQVGAYPRLYDDALGAQLDLTIKDGSREAPRVAGTLGGTTESFIGQGPLLAGRGSWIAGMRNSYRPWSSGTSPQDTAFAFSDLHAKVVYDVSSTEQIAVTALGGRSMLDTMDEPFDGAFGAGIDRAGLATVGWRSTIAPRTIIQQRLFVVGQDLSSTSVGGQPWGRVTNRAIGYRADAMHGMLGGVLNGGVDVTGLSGTRAGAVAGASVDPVHAAWTTRAMFVDFARTTAAHVSVDVGARASQSTLVRNGAVSPWITASWQMTPGWVLTGSTGISHQFPELDAVLGSVSPMRSPERATNVDVGIQRQFERMRWRATAFMRRESDVVNDPDLAPRLVEGAMVAPSSPGTYRNSLRSIAHGFDVVATPRGTTRLSGWLSYTYTATRQTDTATGETFWGDFDRRHAFNANAVIALGNHAAAGIVMRAASGVPLPGYFDLHDGVLTIGAERNRVRLPPYTRLDVRMQRTFFPSRHALTMFGEVLNALNARNEGVTAGVFQPATGDAVGFIRPLSARRILFGITVELGR